jgi:hypothetical protein
MRRAPTASWVRRSGMESVDEIDIVYTKVDDESAAISEAASQCGRCEWRGRLHRKRWGFPISRCPELDRNGYFAWKVTFSYD